MTDEMTFVGRYAPIGVCVAAFLLLFLLLVFFCCENRHRINVAIGEHEQRNLMTGEHIVADIHCNMCDSVLGWKYVRV